MGLTWKIGAYCCVIVHHVMHKMSCGDIGDMVGGAGEIACVWDEEEINVGGICGSHF
jgi:hypothetical protein